MGHGIWGFYREGGVWCELHDGGGGSKLGMQRMNSKHRRGRATSCRHYAVRGHRIRFEP